jgi:Ni,Fe-hydrogenase I cytochrome b subunit
VSSEFPNISKPDTTDNRYSPFTIFAFIMGVWNQIAEYLYLKKKDPNRPKDKWIGYMHGINRISLLIFILCLIILAIKLLRK